MDTIFNQINASILHLVKHKRAIENAEGTPDAVAVEKLTTAIQRLKQARSELEDLL